MKVCVCIKRGREEEKKRKREEREGKHVTYSSIAHLQCDIPLQQAPTHI